jgi:protein ImuA
MQIVSGTDKLLQTLSVWRLKSSVGSDRSFSTGTALDALAPGGGWIKKAVHEILSPTAQPSAVLPMLIARSAAQRGRVVWCDFARNFYPPAAAAMGLPLDRLVLLRTGNRKEEFWAATECLRSTGVSACIMAMDRLTFLQARRLQLASERGGGVGLLLRSTKALNQPYAAATRWIVRPAPGQRTVQRWLVTLIHGHGGRVGQSVLLEVSHETHHVRAFSPLVDRPGQTSPAVASA